MRCILLLIALMGLTNPMPLLANKSIKREVQSYGDLIQFAEKNHLLNPQVLWVFDNDDTITMPPCNASEGCQYIGSPIWFEWQVKLLSMKQSKDRVASTMAGLVKANAIIDSITDSQLVEPKQERALFSKLSQRSVPVMVATHRDEGMSNSTNSTFSRLQIAHFLKSHAPKCGVIPSLPFPVMVTGLKRAVRYENGILYTAGQSKSLGVSYVLKRCHHRYRTLVFVDDLQRNVDEMVSHFGNHLTVVGLRYNHLDEYKQQFQSKQQSIASQHWQHLMQGISWSRGGSPHTKANSGYSGTA